MRACFALSLCLACALAHAAEPYPNKPIRIILLVVPGGGSDITARAVGQKLTQAWGQQVVIDNRPSANGIVGMEIASHAAPDGYTLVMGTIGPLAVTPSLYRKLPYDPVRDFTPIARAVSALNTVVVHPSLPVHSVKDLIAHARANPGKLSFGSSGAGAADHLAGELFNSLAGVKMQHVPYKGGTAAMVDLLGGSLQLIFATVSTSIMHVQAGRIRLLAVTSANRVDLFPDVPTIAEAGVPGYVVDNWYGFVAPRGVPKPIVEKLHREINAVFEMPDVKQRMRGLGIVAFPLPTAEAFGGYIRSEITKYAKIVKEAGIRAD